MTRQAMLIAAALLATASSMNSRAETSSSWRVAQASPPAEQKSALEKATQVKGKIKALDPTARTLTLESNQVFTLPRTIEVGPWKAGDTVLVTFEPDTTTAISVEPGTNIQ